VDESKELGSGASGRVYVGTAAEVGPGEWAVKAVECRALNTELRRTALATAYREIELSALVSNISEWGDEQELREGQRLNICLVKKWGTCIHGRATALQFSSLAV
jgi:hypothetical protein